MMNATKRIGSLLLSTVLLASAVEAQSDRAPNRGGLFGALDRNGDGKIDADEIDLAVASLRKLDKNKDGEITREEMGFSFQRGGGQSTRRGFQGFASLDKDGDGKISKEEAPERMKERFDRMDANGDGFIDKKEQEEIMRRFRDAARPQQQRRTDRAPERGAGEGGSDKPKRPAPKQD